MDNMQASIRTLFVLVTLSSVISLAVGEFKLLLLHTNDMHSRFEETNSQSGRCHKNDRCYGGFARLKAAVDDIKTRAKEEGLSTLLLNAGDTYQGTTLFTEFKDKVVTELLNMMNFDVLSLGNHEFDEGPAGLAPFLNKSSSPVVCANIDYSQEPALSATKLPRLTKSVVLNVDGTKVGVIGYLTPETMTISKTGEVKFLDEVVAMKEEAARLTAEGVKILIGLGHSGYSRDQQIASQVPGLDVVVGGHTNTFLYSGSAPDIEKVEGPYPTVVKQPSGREVRVVQAYAYTKYLGHLTLTFDSQGEVIESHGNPLLLDGKTYTRKDEEVEKTVLKYTNEFKEKSDKKIGKTKVFLDAGESCRIRECNFGNLVTDALIERNALDYSGSGWTDAPIAMIGGGALRTSINASLSGGVITYEDLSTSLPFFNPVIKVTMKGKILREVMEHSVARYSVTDRPGAFMQYSGVQVVYDLTKPPGARVINAQVRCGQCAVPAYQPLEDDQEYSILTSGFLADGGDGYEMIKKEQNKRTLSFTDSDAVSEYLNKFSPVMPEVSGRIQILESTRIGSSASTISISTIPSLFILFICFKYIS